MTDRIVVLGTNLFYPLEKKSEERKKGYALFDRYKKEWVDGVMEDEPDGEFRDDLFDTWEEYLDFWGTTDDEMAEGFVYAKKYDEFTDKDEAFYKQLVDEAEEKDWNNVNRKKNIKILDLGDDLYQKFRRVEARCSYHWEKEEKKLNPLGIPYPDENGE